MSSKSPVPFEKQIPPSLPEKYLRPELTPLGNMTFPRRALDFSDGTSATSDYVPARRGAEMVLATALYASSDSEVGGFSIKFAEQTNNYTNSAAIVMVSNLAAMGILSPREFAEHLSKSKDGPALERQNIIAKNQSLQISPDSESERALQDRMAALEAAKLFALQWQALYNALEKRGEKDWIKPISDQLRASQVILKKQSQILGIAKELSEIERVSAEDSAAAASLELKTAELKSELSLLESVPEIISLKEDVRIIRVGAIKENPDATFQVASGVKATTSWECGGGVGAATSLKHGGR